MSGAGLKILLKESRYLIFKRQNDRKIRRVFTWFSHFCMSLPHLCPFLATTIRLSKDNSKIINSSFFPACLRLWATARSENIRYFLQIKSYLRFRVCFVRHLECFYTGAKNSTRYHVYDCANWDRISDFYIRNPFLTFELGNYGCPPYMYLQEQRRSDKKLKELES